MSLLNEKLGSAKGVQESDEWIKIRESRTKQAIEDDDLEGLRKISALPGGFGSEGMRKKAWSTLLRTHRLDPHVEHEGLVDKVVRDASPDQAASAFTPSLSSGESSCDAGPSELKAHPNERQVKLDTDRSFVTFPKGLPAQNKLDLQADLNNLIIGVLRKYPALSYFQGYHDILSVLYLTFIPPKPIATRSRSSSRSRIRKIRSMQSTHEPCSIPVESSETRVLDEQTKMDVTGIDQDVDENTNKPLGDQPSAYESSNRDSEDWREVRKCAEMISLNRVRDAMGSGMEGMMGLLRILKRILKAADPELSEFSAKISPVPTLPFFALSWVLTLFSHDCDHLSPIQRMFDYLLARNPISAVYLAAAILISKKPQMLELARQLGEEYIDDPTLLHPLFVRLPPLYPDTPSNPEPPVPSVPSPITESARKIKEFHDDTPNPYKPIKLSQLFQLTDDLMEQFPWDGEIIKGKEIMGEGSVVYTYSKESDETRTPETMLDMIDREVVRPGAGTAIDDDDEEERRPITHRRKSPIRLPRNKVKTILAVGIVVVGIGMAFYGFKAGGNEASWTRWWKFIMMGWIGKEAKRTEGYLGKLIGYLRKSLKDVL
ncbi:uncharacterized protein IL334_005922 [Kwoniella shivajii]|uniref:Rab-GAP TBC domain-containing protein n=1 Tax=Kwoniella shivajii TaxID=564305 RepID=A0ABZ1D4V7_9TREE|nr:hypothetical protein IL334_005922 [Kwoniella shivajii]